MARPLVIRHGALPDVVTVRVIPDLVTPVLDVVVIPSTVASAATLACGSPRHSWPTPPPPLVTAGVRDTLFHLPMLLQLRGQQYYPPHTVWDEEADGGEVTPVLATATCVRPLRVHAPVSPMRR